MVDDLVDYRATLLVWSALGGGSLSLPYLEQEAYGAIDARARFYGFVNDSEFIKKCQEHGIKVFGIIFEAQGWEFPVELNDAETEVLALNELRGDGHRDWMGLREFGQNRYPRLWAPVEKYFPAGLINSEGIRVTDLIEECCSRDIHQIACHAHWVECPDRDHQCYYMDRNNPVWREYLKAVIRIQIDAGVDGVQLDEAELPIGALQYGACFCKACMKGFRDYLREQSQSERSSLLDGVDLGNFHYGEWLLQKGYDFKDNRESTPLFFDYYRYQCLEIKKHFKELADYIRAYGHEQGREVLVSGNFFNLDPHYLPLADDVDLLITEMRNTTYRQPEWYRYVAGFAGDKDVVVVENPYGGVVPELVEDLRKGRGVDRFRLSLLEAAAMGVNMTVPYGAWMGSRIEDAFYAPHDVAVDIQDFLAENEGLFSKETYNEVGVAFSVESTRELISRQDSSDIIYNRRDESVEVPFRVVSSGLADAAVPFDVILFPDGVTADDRVTVQTLHRYRTVVLPACSFLTVAQAESLLTYLNHDGHVVVTGAMGENLPEALRDEVLSHPGVTRADHRDVDSLVPLGRQISGSALRDVAVNIHRLSDDSAAIHLVDYAYDAALDGVPTRSGMQLTVRLPRTWTHATAVMHTGQTAEIEVAVDDGYCTVALPDVALYCIVVLHSGNLDELRSSDTTVALAK
jgi:hypothetical protein